MVFVALALGLILPISVMAWLYLRLELELRTEDKVSARRLERFGNGAFAVFTDLADDRPFGITAPRLGRFQTVRIDRRF